MKITGILFLIALLCFAFFDSKAQNSSDNAVNSNAAITKGTRLIGGTVSAGGNINPPNSWYNFSINPMAGIFITDRLQLSGNIGLTYQVEGKSPYINQYFSAGIGPGLDYYFCVKGRSAFFTGLMLYLNETAQHSESVTTYDYRSYGLTPYVSVGYDYFLTNYCALSVYLNDFTNIPIYDSNHPTAKIKGTNIRLFAGVSWFLLNDGKKTAALKFRSASL